MKATLWLELTIVALTHLSAGFGSVCTLATVAWPFFTSAAVVALLYPLFILIAGDADPKPAYRNGAFPLATLHSSLQLEISLSILNRRDILSKYVLPSLHDAANPVGHL